MITGFNTDIEHDGTVYHVQTEDKGLESPIILSLVYSGGAILASKRSPYEDLIASGYSDEALSERLKRQHRLICAAIHSGRIEDLKKMSGREPGQTGPLLATGPLVVPEEVAAPVGTTEEDVVTSEEDVVTSEEDFVTSAEDFFTSEEALDAEPPSSITLDEDIVLGIDAQQEMIWEMLSKKKETEEQAKAQEPEPEPEPPAVEAEQVPQQPFVEPYTVYDQRRSAEISSPDAVEGVVIKLLDDEEFVSGELRMLRVFVSERYGEKERALVNFPVSIKILGTAFRPLIYSVKTERDGVASVQTEIPHFTSGRAAVLIRVVGKDTAAELRRVILPFSGVQQ